MGSVPKCFFDKLKNLLKDPWQPFAFSGVHHCKLCQYDSPSGHANLFVPDGSRIFVCPELIVHYIAAHHYQPPEAFVDAVEQCPDTRTMEYKKRFLQSGGRYREAVRRRL